MVMSRRRFAAGRAWKSLKRTYTTPRAVQRKMAVEGL
jgi:hypothetical protein